MADPAWKLLVKVDHAVCPKTGDAVNSATLQEIWFKLWVDGEDWVCHVICADV